MTTITLFEHQELSYKDLGWDANHPALNQIETLNRAHGVELIERGRYGLKARQFVGIVRVGELSIQILPKLDYLGNISRWLFYSCKRGYQNS